jgi:hypothetical protein
MAAERVQALADGFVGHWTKLLDLVRLGASIEAVLEGRSRVEPGVGSGRSDTALSHAGLVQHGVHRQAGREHMMQGRNDPCLVARRGRGGTIACG